MKPLSRLSNCIWFTLVLTACFSDRKNPVAPISSSEKWFPMDVSGLDSVVPSKSLDLKNGDTLRLLAAPVKKFLMGRYVRMLAYNGSIPGPIIRVPEGAEITLILKNQIGIPTMLHSHGVRLESKYDGTMDVQNLIAQGDSFAYTIRFPDPGLFWYHPHYREDYAKELGLYGNFFVVPKDTGYWTPVNREELLMLDDFFLDTTQNGAPFRTDDVDRTMMGRFGNLVLINGDSAFNLTVKRNEVVRFYATNSSNTRVWNVGIMDPENAILRFKLVGSDNGQYEYFDTVSTVLLAPSERRIFEVRFNVPGIHNLTHIILKSRYNNDSTIALGKITVLPESTDADFRTWFEETSGSALTRKSIDSIRTYAELTWPVDKSLLLTGTMVMTKTGSTQDGPISIEGKGIEWKDHMAEMNSVSNLKNMKWVIRDFDTGLENHAIRWSFKRGEKVKIRIQNDELATHPMPHPIHFHGQRFLITAVNNRKNLNMAWKDSYLIGTGETTDILLDASNPGMWMAQCHISEHFENMMMFNYTVE